MISDNKEAPIKGIHQWILGLQVTKNRTKLVHQRLAYDKCKLGMCNENTIHFGWVTISKPSTSNN